ncbi:hypothetical protein JCM24511_06954 [Saitozyma sp. JCM 24511]|nr:hypothetical protein JCM24511_06954 [Saitozyma sp. JCM 24511]
MPSNEWYGPGYYYLAKGQIHDLSVNDGSGTEAGEAVVQIFPFMRVFPDSDNGSVILAHEFSLLSGSDGSLGLSQRAAGLSDCLEQLQISTTREVGSLPTFASVEEVFDKAEKNLENVLEKWCESARKNGLTWVWNTGDSWSGASVRRALLFKTHMENSYAVWRECPIRLRPEATIPSTYHRVTTRPGLAQIPVGQSPDTERLYLYSVIRKTIPSRSDPAADADDNQAESKLHFFAIPATHPESQAPWADEYVARYRPERDPSLQRIPPSSGSLIRDLRSIITTAYKWETLVKQSAQNFASEFLVEIAPEGSESEPQRITVPGLSRGPG